MVLWFGCATRQLCNTRILLYSHREIIKEALSEGSFVPAFPPARHGAWGWTTRALLDPWSAAIWHISILAFNLHRKKKDSRISKCHCLILRSSLRKLPILLSASNCKIPSVQEGQRKTASLARGPGVFLQDRRTLRAQKKPTCHTELQKILSFFF